MLSVPLAEDEVAPLLAPWAGQLSVAAVNEPSRTVVSGPDEAVAGFERDLAARGVEARRLHTSHAFHSAMMDPILAAFAERVRRVRRNPPQIPWLSNLTGTWITAEQAVDPEAWARQLRGTVRFADLLTELAADPERIFLEVGPGRTLATFARRVAPQNLTITSLRAPVETDDDQATALAALGRLWIAGVEIDWQGFHGDEKRRRVPLPTYPFERQRYWIDGTAGIAGQRRTALLAAEAPLEAGLAKRPAVDDWFYVPVWSNTPAPRPGDFTGDPRRRWLVVLDRHGLGAALAARLVEEGREVVTAEAGNPEAYATLLRDLAAADRLPQAVVHAASVDPAPSFAAAQESGFLSLVGLAHALSGVGLGTETPVEIWVLTDRAHRVTGSEEMAPAAATVFGPCRVIPQEMPAAVCQSVDLDLATEPGSAGRLLAEIGAGPAGRPVAWRGGRRWLQSFEPARLDAAGRPLRPLRERGIYLITGGLEGNGYGVARFLAGTLGARLVLPESLPLPEEKTARVQALEQAGAEVLVVAADLTDEAALAWAVSQAVEHFGALHGVIHAAAVVGERTFRPLTDTGAAEAAWHFTPRALGLIALDAALAGRELDFRLTLSSLAAVLGGVGYAAYAASHLFVDAFAQATSGRADGGWLAVGWDLWDLGGAAGEPDAATVSTSLAAFAMTPDEGGEVLRRVLAAATAEVVEVSTGDLALRRAQTARRAAPAERVSGGATRHPRPPLQTPYAAPESDLERRIATVWQDLLGFAEIGANDNFFELGGDSFIAVRVAAKLREELGTDLPVAELYQRLTIRSLAELLERDATQATAELAAHLDERRESMDRRKEMLRRRRERKETVET
jgi:acyl transferase domain-containing protein